MTAPRPPRSAVAFVLAAAALWGTAGAAQELGASTAAPASVAAVRSFAGGALLLGTLGLMGRLDRVVTAVRLAPVAAGASALSMTAFQVGYLTGVRHVGVGLGTLVAIGSAPAWAGLLAAIAGRRPSRRWLLATAATIAGAGVLLLGGEGVGTGTGSGPSGVLAALGAGAAYGTYTTVSKRLLEVGADGPAAVTVAMSGAGLLLSPLLLATDLTWLVSFDGVVAALWLTVATIVVAYVLFARGLRDLDAPSVTTLTLAEPLTATVLGVLLLAERPSALGWSGAALLAVGLAAVGGRPARQ